VEIVAAFLIMISTLNVILCAVLAVLFWTCIGFAVGQRILPRALALPLAPTLGWAVQNALALPIFFVLRFSQTNVVVVAVLALAISLIAIRRGAAREPTTTLPCWAYALAAVLALAPMVAILPKSTIGDGIILAGPMFDHVKVAMIDDMVRMGLPPGNPFFGESGDRLAYYYLWHFGAAQFALVLGISGWEADAAMTWFSALASLTLMMGLASWFAGRGTAALWVALLALGGSLRFPLWLLFGTERVDELLLPATGLGGWLFQASWVPQHVMAAGCVVLAILQIGRLGFVLETRTQSQRIALLPVAALALVAVAGFESSTWIGGVTLAAAAPAAGLVRLSQLAPGRRVAFIATCAVAAILAIAWALPVLHDQWVTTAARQPGFPLGIEPYEVLGPAVPESVRRIFDLPAFWLVLLVIEFPAIVMTGTIILMRSIALESDRQRKELVEGLASLIFVCFVVAWLVTSRLGEHNDLGWRAVLPAVFVLIVFTAIGLARWVAAGAYVPACAALLALALALPEGIKLIANNATGHAAPSALAFARAPALWAAVRAHTTGDERLANNPLYLADITPWPDNISWALLANRRSCFAGREVALAYVSLPHAQREEINAQFIRVFAGQGSADDVRDLAQTYHCRVVVLTPSDGAWSNDPFAASPLFHLVEMKPDRWRIYRAD
jgi:hypothetical protein